MKDGWRSRFDALRNRFVLTPEEKRVIAFVLIAFVLGLGAKSYRETHPPPPRKIDKKHAYISGATPSPSTSPKRARKPRKKTDIAPVAPDETQAPPGKD